MSGAIIRRMESRDIPAVLQIQAHSGEAAQWSETAYDDLCQAGAVELAWVAEREERIVGFLAAREVAKEMEILNFAIDPAARREGMGSALLCCALAHAAENGAASIFLEVRACNLAALSFYQARGFASAGIRANYYRHPVEAALLLSASLPLPLGKTHLDPRLAARRKM